MKTFSLFLASLLLSAFFLGCTSNQGSEGDTGENGEEIPQVEPEDRVPLLLIGLDGFKPSYLNEEDYGDLPNFRRLIDGGVLAESLEPVFPSKTFVNLYSLATGLYPENTGIVGNVVYDPILDERLHMHDNEAQGEAHWWGGEPIWITAERQGVRAGTYFWVGSEAPYDGLRPTHWMEYNSAVPHLMRIDQVVEWLSADDPVEFATLYFARPDATGHSHGPRSHQMANTVQNMDSHIGYLLDELEEAGIWPDINIILVSDHGMVELDENKLIMLDEIIDMRDVDVVEWSPVAMISPRGNLMNQVFRRLEENQENYTVYRREDLPERYRLKNNHRVPEIIVVADMPYTITTQYFLEERGVLTGGHGYDPQYPEMHGFFLGHGPHFRSGHQTDTLHLVDIYALMTHLLALEPAENDGSLQRIGPQVLRPAD